ncbi:MAG TPA: MotA/TolQ/ExbB proton channel family protein [Gammaproteobacteria bacterium]|nr:MotA/TolQ/ExbB proton channel family protein [Gammaproteobacteria bacterium]
MIISAIHSASWVVFLIMMVLGLLSIYSWVLIIGKWKVIHQQQRRMNAFDKEFWSVQDMNELYQMVRAQCVGVLQEQFCAGFEAYQQSEHKEEAMSKAMMITHERHFSNEESSLQLLATLASTAPYIGLLGTVLGVMHAFQGLGGLNESVAIQVLAPGMAEALLTTALGLFVAIPAMIANNRFVASLEAFERRSLLFQREFAYIMMHKT